MVASYWRLRRAWAIETRLLENETEAQTSGDSLDRMAKAFSDLAATPSLGLMHRYQTRLHLNYQRALYNMLLLRAATVPNEPRSSGTDDRLFVVCQLVVCRLVVCQRAPHLPACSGPRSRNAMRPLWRSE